MRPTTNRISAVLLPALLALSAVIAIPQAPVSAAPVSVAIGVAFDGTPTFDSDDLPGNDSADDNLIVRTHDTVGYNWFYNTDAGGATNPRLASTVPDGMIWSVVPPQCVGATTGIYDSASLPALVAGGDERHMVCHLADTNTTVSEVVTPVAMVLGDNSTNTHDQGTLLTTNVGFSADEISGSITSPDQTVTLSAGLFLNVRKFTPVIGSQSDGPGPTGTDSGVVFRYHLAVEVDHPIRTGSDGVKGLTQIEDTFTFTDSLAAISPGAQLFDWGSYGDGCWDVPAPWTNVSAGSGLDHGSAPTTDVAVPDSGDWSCSQSGSDVTITVSNMDSSGSSFPTRTASGGSVLPADQRLVATQIIWVWIPIDDVLDGEDETRGTVDDGTLSATNSVLDFNPDDRAGRSNYGPDLEDPADNDWTHALASGVGRSKQFLAADAVYAPPTTASALWGGDGYANMGSRSTSIVHLQNAGVVPFNNVQLCDKFDNTAFRLGTMTRAGQQGPHHWVNRYNGAEGVGITVEFGIGGAGGAGATWASFDDISDSTCDDSESTVWSTNPADPALGGTIIDGASDAITKVRTTVIGPVPPGGVVQFYTALVVEGPSLLPDSNDGQVLFNRGMWKADELWGGAWDGGNYDPLTHTGSVVGDRLLFTGALARVDKVAVEAVPGSGNTFLAGTPARFEISPTITTSGDVDGAPASDVIVTDVLPPGLTLVAGSVTPSITNGNAAEYCLLCDGSDWTTAFPAGAVGVRWLFGDVPLNTTLPTLGFDALVPFDAPDGTNYLNTAVVSTPSDSSDEAERSSSAGIVAVQPAAVSAGKVTTTPLLPLDTQMSYTLQLANTSDADVSSLDVIDILPYTGDPKALPSDFAGGYNAVAVANLPAGMDVYVTDQPVAAMDAADGSAGDGYADPGRSGIDAWYVTPATGVWACSLGQLGTAGCPTATSVTGLRFVSNGTVDPILPQQQAQTWDVLLTPVGNADGDLYTNTFAARVDASLLPLPVFSPEATVRVTAPSVMLEKEICLDFSGVDCDPAVDAHWGEATILPENVPATFRLSVTNTGQSDLIDVEVVDALPAGLTFVNGSTSGPGNFTGFPTTWITSIVAGETAVGTFQALADGPSATPIVNSATATATDQFDQTDSDTDDASVTEIRALGEISGGVYDDDGAPLGGVTVTLTGTDIFGQPVSIVATTLADGSYEFPDLLAGSYIVTETQPAGYGDGVEEPGTNGAASTTNDVITVTLDWGDASIDNDFIETLGSIAGTVFHDLDGDGIQDAGETGIPGVTVTLTGTDSQGGTVSTVVTTDTDGNYIFPDLLSSDATGYAVTETQPSVYDDGIDTVGSAGGNAATNDEVTGIVLATGVDATDYDFAEVGTVVSGTVWLDENRDGVIDAAETTRLAGVTITLTDGAGNVIATTTTDANGFYSFNVSAGDYTITESQPSGHGSTTVNTLEVVVPLGGLVEQNFGEYLGSIAGTVWDDVDGDGLQGSTESGVSGVDVELLDSAGNIVATATTDPNGDYVFPDLPAGDYTIVIVPPTGETFTTEGAGSDETVDSDVNISTGSTQTVTIAVGDCGSSPIGAPLTTADCVNAVAHIDAGLVDAVTDLSIDKATTASSTSKGGNVDWTFTVTNLGTTAVNGMQITDQLPGSLRYVSFSGTGWACAVSGQAVSCQTSQQLKPGEKTPVLTVTTKITGSGTINNLANVAPLGSNITEVTTSNNTDLATITVSVPGTLAFTGSSVQQSLAAVGALLLLAGSLLVGYRRRLQELA